MRERSFSGSRRHRVLQWTAIGILVYSIVVPVYANLRPTLGLHVFGRLVHAIDGEPFGDGTRPRAGDVVVSLAGSDIESLPHWVAQVGRLKRLPTNQLGSHERPADLLRQATGDWADVGGRRFVRVRFERAGPDGPLRFDSWFELTGLPWHRVVVGVVWLSIQMVLFWIGWLVHRRDPEDDSAALLWLVCIATVGAFMGGYFWLDIAGSASLTFVFALCAMAVPQLTLHFLLTFPAPSRALTRWPRLTLMLLYVLPGVLQLATLWSIGAVISAYRHRSGLSDIQYSLDRLQFLLWLCLGLAVVAFLGCFGRLAYSYLRTTETTQRNQVRWILFGALLASPLLAYTVWLAVSRPVGFALGGATWAMFVASLIFALAYSVSITRYRLLVVEELLQRGVCYLLISFAVGLAYYGLLVSAVWFSPTLADDSSHGQVLLAPLFVMVVLLVLTTVRSRLQRLVDRRFFTVKHQIDRAMARMDQAVGDRPDADELYRRPVEVVVDTIDAAGGAAYLRDAGASYRLQEAVGWDESRVPPPERIDGRLATLVDAGGLLQATPGPVMPGDEAAWLMRPYGWELLRPLTVRGQVTGFLVFGAKRNGAYQAQDLQFCMGLADLTEMALHGAESLHKLESLNADLQKRVTRMSRQKRQLMLLQTDDEGVPLEEPADPVPVAGDLLGESPAMQRLRETVEQVAASDVTVLLRGESGTGKTRLAEIIHRKSGRRDRPLVKVHCAALSDGLLESELFGHVKGAFTGADGAKVGRFEKADGGTLFLDEIGDVQPAVQVKLLRVLQEQTFERVGSTEPIRVDVRVIAATHQPLEKLIATGRLREDLFYRLNVVSVRTPALRERPDDVCLLATRFLRRCAQKMGKTIESIDGAALDRLSIHSWPGNVRELENVIERAVVLSRSRVLTVADLPPEIAGRRPAAAGAAALAPHRSVKIDQAGEGLEQPAPLLVGAAHASGDRPPGQALALPEELAGMERRRLIDALRQAGGNKSEAARILGMPRTTFCSKLKKFDLW